MPPGEAPPATPAAAPPSARRHAMTRGGTDRARRHWHALLSGARRYFLTGLVIILPTFLTFYVLWFLWGLVDAILAPVTDMLFRPFLARQTVPVLVTALSALAAAALVWLIGFTSAAWSRRFFERTEAAFSRVPLVRGIHRTVKQLLELFVATDSSFKQVAAIEYPRKGLYCICFVTNPARWTLPHERGRRAVPVFIPTTPVPTSGYFLLVPEEDVIPLDISVDEAIKVIISGGLIAPSTGDLSPTSPPVNPRP
jgi:uncharacterized membrane protein